MFAFPNSTNSSCEFNFSVRVGYICGLMGCVSVGTHVSNHGVLKDSRTGSGQQSVATRHAGERVQAFIH